MASFLPRAAGIALAVAGLTGATAAHAAPPEPSGPHPRLFLDAKTKASLQALAKKEGTNAVTRAIAECRRAGSNLQDEARNIYMGFHWAAHTSNCALAYHATGDAALARTGIHFFTALLDDWGTVGDGKGGDTAVRHDSGYAIRAFGPHAALAYDLLHDAPGMTPALLAKARGRFAAWTDWYYGDGYRFKSPGTNYHAGYLFAATAIAIAQGSEAGAAGAKLWRHVVDEVWAKQMRPAAAPGGLLEGGDWGEGWQYAPLSVASYALAARAMLEQGIALPEYTQWAEDIVVRHVHALGPGDKGLFVGGDTGEEKPSLAPNVWTLAGVAAGPAPDRAAAWARAELQRLHLSTEKKSFLLYEALAEARGVPPAPYPRESGPTFYVAKGIGTLYARSSWAPSAVWMAMQCTKTVDVDHMPPNAGNFVLSRGADELVVDPSPYGSLSSLTGNAPTVESAQLPADYKPSQGFWSERTRYAWARQTESAIVAARCDYADQYRFQERPSDVPMAVRDVVLVPSDGNATMVVVDRAHTGGASRGLHLRFRTTAGLALGGEGVAQGTTGRSALRITPVYATSGTPAVRQATRGNCFGNDTTRGSCMAARFPVSDYVVQLKGEQATAIHVLDATSDRERPPPPHSWTGTDHRAIAFERGKRRAVVVVAEPGARARLAYRAEPGHHVVLDAPASAAGRARVETERDGTACRVTVTPASSGGLDARPLAMVLSDTCDVKEDPTATRSAAAPGGAAVTVAAAPAATFGDGPHAKTFDEVFVPPAPSGPAPHAGSGRGCGGCAVAVPAPAPGAGLLVALAPGLFVLRRRRQRSTMT